MKILLATTNKKKIKEIKEILADPNLAIVTPDEINLSIDVIEDGSTFEENSTKKALAWAKASHITALADDSGLCVDALNGKPGVLSARFAGPNSTDQDNYTLLLKKLKDEKNRNAHFVCVMALASPDGKVITAKGEYHGVILEKPIGSNGFGYDPVFLDPSSNKTFAQLTPEEKNTRSHRKRALINLKEKLKELRYI
jgi:XTP/dITP diphosphohydrolase